MRNKQGDRNEPIAAPEIRRGDRADEVGARGGRGWLSAQIKYRENGRSRTKQWNPSKAVDGNGPYFFYCYHRKGKSSTSIYLGKKDSRKFQRFWSAWHSGCSTAEIIRRIKEK